MTRYIQHNQKCFACGLHKAPAHLGYNIETMKTYCTEKTPCEKAYLIPAGELIPVTNEDLLASITENFTEDVQETFNRLLGKVASTRLQPAHIMHVLKTSKAEGLTSIQATLVNIIEADMKARNVDHIQIDGSKFTHKVRKEPKREEISQAENFLNQSAQAFKSYFSGPSIADLLKANEAEQKEATYLQLPDAPPPIDFEDPKGEELQKQVDEERAEDAARKAELEKIEAEEKARILQEEIDRLTAKRKKEEEEKAKEAEEDDEWEI